jgi:hypothetical protein
MTGTAFSSSSSTSSSSSSSSSIIIVDINYLILHLCASFPPIINEHALKQQS